MKARRSASLSGYLLKDAGPSNGRSSNWTGKIFFAGIIAAISPASSIAKLRAPRCALSSRTYALNLCLSVNLMRTSSWNHLNCWIFILNCFIFLHLLEEWLRYQGPTMRIQLRSMIGSVERGLTKNVSRPILERSYNSSSAASNLRGEGSRVLLKMKGTFIFSKVQYKLILEFDFKRTNEIDLNMADAVDRMESWSFRFNSLSLAKLFFSGNCASL